MDYAGSYDFFFFFFQAEDGIRDVAVTGVQTCALPISVVPREADARPGLAAPGGRDFRRPRLAQRIGRGPAGQGAQQAQPQGPASELIIPLLESEGGQGWLIRTDSAPQREELPPWTSPPLPRSRPPANLVLLKYLSRSE